jgi:nitrate reductase gamma subunit
VGNRRRRDALPDSQRIVRVEVVLAPDSVAPIGARVSVRAALSSSERGEIIFRHCADGDDAAAEYPERKRAMKTNFLFAAWPYIAFSLLVVGIGVRYLLDRRQMEAVAKEMAEARALFGGGKIWRASLLLLIAAHFVGMVLPRVILWWNGSAGRLYLLEGVGWIVGSAALLCCFAVVWRHLERSNRPLIAELSDTVFLALLFVGILSGVLTALLYRWGSTWSAVTLAPYLASLVRAKPATGLTTQMPFLVRLHVFSAFAALAVFPLTRPAAFLIFAVDWTFGLVGRPTASTARALEAWMRKRSPAAWLWPEED